MLHIDAASLQYVQSKRVGRVQLQTSENHFKVNKLNHYISLMKQPLGLVDMSSNGKLYLEIQSVTSPPSFIASLLSSCVDNCHVCVSVCLLDPTFLEGLTCIRMKLC